MATNTRKLAALLGSSGANITDAGTINTAGITNDAINADKIVANAVGTSEVDNNVLTAADLAANSVGESELSVDYTAQSVPHIVPGILQPAVAGKLLNGANHSGAYGTPQTQSGGDGHSYYYTDIKGSKPIKDPRIGAHFGSQRHKFKSIQLLKQETATQGADTYSVDGREWIRMSGTAATDIEIKYHGSGNMIKLGNATDFIEITGYFNDINIRLETHPNYDGWTKQLNGGSASAGQSAVTADSPLTNRYVDSGSVLNVGVGATLGINTVRINSHNDNIYVFGIELIAQDTTSTANRSKIQIPSQNVVSFGKKFSVSGTPHYDPFTTMSYGGSGTTLSALQSLIDTDTSLGMDAWKAGTSNYHRPWNGGRVIKWVDSSGTIKTSVNMMPPNAQNIGTTASNPVSDAHVIAGTNDDTINFNTSAVDHAQSELAKTFYYREFGNGAANEGTTTSGSKQDFSMLNFKDDVAYVMDDGLTGMSGKEVTGEAIRLEIGDSNNEAVYLTFIGTGISYTGGHTGDPGPFSVAKNLPYGTHILKINRLTSSSDTGQLFIDGVNIWDQPSGRYGMRYPFEFSFYQPKRPPIPEDCVVLADYMLMADFVVQSVGTVGHISKGVRSVSSSRDFFFDGVSLSSNLAVSQSVGNVSYGYRATSPNLSASDDTATYRLPYFGTDFVVQHYANRTGTLTENLNSDAGTATAISTSAFEGHTKHIGNTLALNEIKNHHAYGVNDAELWTQGCQIATPIHTSHHYQTFETPFLNELVGGDRNMEQTNLVCSPDGKTWDEVTRDTSYIGNLKVCVTSDDDVQWNSYVILDEWRGRHEARDWFNKDFAIAYDRLICLRDGCYELWAQSYANSNGAALSWYVSGSSVILSNSDASNHIEGNGTVYIKRGDEIRLRGEFGIDSLSYNMATITRV